MVSSIITYLCDKVLIDLRQSNTLGQEISLQLASFHYTNQLRQCLRPEDSIWALKLLKAGSYENKLLALAILKPLQENDDIKKHIYLMWNDKLSKEMRISLIYRLLDLPDLNSKMHEEIFNWMIGNGAFILKRVIEWYDGSENVVGLSKKRLADPNFPIQKKWIYLLQIAWMAPPSESYPILAEYSKADLPLVSGFAQRIQNLVLND